MFDVGFWELTIIAVVALLVIGPERLPRVARTTGLWVGKARRFVSSVKADIDREIAADELKKTLAKHAESQSLYDIIEDTKQGIQDTKEQIAASVNPATGAEPATPEATDSASTDTRESLTQKPNDTSGS